MRASWIDFVTVGTILMIGGGVGLAASLLVQYARRRSHARGRVYEQRYYEEPHQ